MNNLVRTLQGVSVRFLLSQISVAETRRTSPRLWPLLALMVPIWLVHSRGVSAQSEQFVPGIGQVVIEADGLSIADGQKVRAKVTVMSPASSPSGSAFTVNYEDWAEINLRGNSSRLRPKHPYRLELQDESGHDLKASLLGMPAESDWILHPCYTDKTLVRDALAYELWRAMGHYAPRTRYVELFFRPAVTNALSTTENASVRTAEATAAFSSLLADPFAVTGASKGLAHSRETPDGYAGLYLLVEKIKRGKHRVDIRKSSIDDPDPLWLIGGYIFKKDRPNPGEQGFMSSETDLRFFFEDPKEKDMALAQKEWLQAHVNTIEQTLLGPDFRDPSKGYATYIDVDSFVDFHWMVEVSRNIDGYWYSQFFHMDRGGKLKAGPIWDWDLSFGNVFYHSGYKTNGWRWQTLRGSHYKWYARLFEDPDFLQRYIDRWAELRGGVFATSNVLARLDALVEQIREAQGRNYRRWPTLGENLDPVYFVGHTYDEEVQWLKTWIINRLAWIDSQGFPTPTATFATQPGEPTRRLSLSCQAGKIYYTRTGTDPRTNGGQVAKEAAQYTGPIAAARNTMVVARALSDYGLWSAPLRVRSY